MPPPPLAVHGHAIISDDDKIAGPDGLTPPALRNDADWAYFQRALDAAAFTVLGRLGHEANPNIKNRRRVVVSSSARRIEARRDATWWNPAEAPFAEIAARLAPEGGIVAVPGGRGVFDLFLRIGFDEFHLVRARGVSVPGGRFLFSACELGPSAEEVLAGAGMTPAPARSLDERVDLTVWRRLAIPTPPR